MGLSLANEGLLWGDEGAADSFQKGTKQLIELIRKLRVCAHHYPNNDYLNSLQVSLLQKVFQEQTNWNRTSWKERVGRTTKTEEKKKKQFQSKSIWELGCPAPIRNKKGK
jgi:hypothetical protein